MRKRGQAWGFDLIVAIVIFISGILIFYLFSINAPRDTQENIENMFLDGNFITDSLLSVGSPDNWDENTVLSIGLTNNNKINQTKLDRFHALADFSSNPSGYQQSRAVFNTKFEFFMNFTETIMTVDSNPVAGIGKVPDSPDNLFKISRITIYQNKPVTLDLYIWE